VNELDPRILIASQASFDQGGVALVPDPGADPGHA
jgi:hypothetical protein